MRGLFLALALQAAAAFSQPKVISLLSNRWHGRVTSMTLWGGQASTAMGEFYYDGRSHQIRHTGDTANGDGTVCNNPFAALAASRHAGSDIVGGEPCEVWAYESLTHNATYCIAKDKVPRRWILTYRHKAAGGKVITTSVNSSLSEIRVGSLPDSAFASSAGCAARGADGIPWECDCKANPDHCADSHYDVAECTALVEVAKAFGFHDGKPFGAPGQLLSVDPIASHTIGCYCCWGNGVQCGENSSVGALYWSNQGLSGTFTSDINKLAKLFRIDIDTNSLHGPIPHLELPSLTDLWAFNNSLTGGFPTGNLPNLWRLFINSNQLTGTLPRGLNVIMPKLRRLDVSGNNFDGTIPPDIPFWNNTNYNQSESSIICGFSGNHWSCPIEPWMRSGPGYACDGNITCVGALMLIV